MADITNNPAATLSAGVDNSITEVKTANADRTVAEVKTADADNTVAEVKTANADNTVTEVKTADAENSVSDNKAVIPETITAEDARRSAARKLKKGSGEFVSRSGRILNVVVFILLSLVAVTMVFPLIYMVATSFMTKNQILSGRLTIIPDPVLIGKYAEVMKKGQFISGIINTIIVEVPVLIFGGFTSSLAAFAFAKMNFRGKNLLFLALLATIMIPFAVVMIPQYVLFTRLGWTNSLLPLIIPGCFGNVSMIFFLRQNLYGIPSELMDAAKIDGCNYFGIYAKIFLPLMKGALGTQLMLWFMGIWNDYLAPTIFLRSEKLWTLQVVIRSFNHYYAIQSDYALIMAASVIAMLPTLVLFFIFQRVIIESIAISGIK